MGLRIKDIQNSTYLNTFKADDSQARRLSESWDWTAGFLQGS